MLLDNYTMQERTLKILEAVVKDFISDGKPISSAGLYRRHKFGIKPAMLRLELEKLVEKGFLKQPYHSAGRLPSDRGYEFFARRILENETAECLCDKELRNLFDEGDWPDLLKELSSRLGAFAAVAFRDREEMIYKSGLENLVENLEEGTLSDIKNIVRDFADLEERLSHANFLNKERGTEVFIGRRSPITKSENLAVIAESFLGNKQDATLFIVGPKKMNYQKALGFVRGLKGKRGANKKSKIK